MTLRGLAGDFEVGGELAPVSPSKVILAQAKWKMLTAPKRTQ
jgi:hypothetical protein